LQKLIPPTGHIRILIVTDYSHHQNKNAPQLFHRNYTNFTIG